MDCLPVFVLVHTLCTVHTYMQMEPVRTIRQIKYQISSSTLKHNSVPLSKMCGEILPSLCPCVPVGNACAENEGNNLGRKKSKVTSSAAAALQNVPQIPHSRGVGAQKSRYLLLGHGGLAGGSPHKDHRAIPQPFFVL